MVAENITRKLDSLGRITIPKGLRSRMGWAENDELEIYTDNDFVCLRKVGNETHRDAITAIIEGPLDDQEKIEKLMEFINDPNI